jgi:hypothetical protein
VGQFSEGGDDRVPGAWQGRPDMPVPDLRLSAIERPRCLHCETRMRLARTSPGPPGFDLRRFECAKCNQVTRKLVVSDPMNGDGVKGWLGGELNRPLC